MEILDVYDINGNKLPKTVDRDNKDLNDGEYVKVSVVWIKNGIRYLIQLASEEKGGEYATTGGHVPTGVTSRDQAIVECKEELGIDLKDECLSYLGPIYLRRAIMDVFLYEDDETDLEELEFNLQKEEVESVVWLTKDEIEDMILKGNLRESTAKHYLQYIKNM